MIYSIAVNCFTNSILELAPLRSLPGFMKTLLGFVRIIPIAYLHQSNQCQLGR